MFFKLNLKVFWFYYKVVLYYRVSYNVVFKYNGFIVKFFREKVEFFNLYFFLVFLMFDVNINYDNEINFFEFVILLVDFEICVDEVNKCLSNFDILKVCGFDGILVCFLKECS